MTAFEHLSKYGVTVAQARVFIMDNIDNPSHIYTVAKQYGVTNEMLGEIYGGAHASDVKSYFSFRGIDSSSLDITAATTIAILAAGTSNASDALNEIYTIAITSTYTHTIANFDPANDKFTFGSGATASNISIVNTADDGMATFTYSQDKGVTITTVTLTGLTTAEDIALTTSSGLSNILA